MPYTQAISSIIVFIGFKKGEVLYSLFSVCLISLYLSFNCLQILWGQVGKGMLYGCLKNSTYINYNGRECKKKNIYIYICV